MGYGLAGRHPVVGSHREPIHVGIPRKLTSHASHKDPEVRLDRLREVKDAFDMDPGDHQGVTLCHGEGVGKGDGVLGHDRRGVGRDGAKGALPG
jgi:hypothetical protein